MGVLHQLPIGSLSRKVKKNHITKVSKIGLQNGSVKKDTLRKSAESLHRTDRRRGLGDPARAFSLFLQGEITWLPIQFAKNAKWMGH
jgi:hypothetical protein